MNKNMGYTLIIIDLICAATGCWIITKSKPAVKNIVDNTEDNNTATSEPAKDYNLEYSAEVSEAEKKGQDFEKFAISLFNKESFKLKEWRKQSILKSSNVRRVTKAASSIIRRRHYSKSICIE